MIFLAVDIGLTGAVAALSHTGIWQIGDIPTKPAEDAGERAKRRVDGKALADLIRFYVPAGDSALVIIEDVQARPMGRRNGVELPNSIQSQGSMMRSRGNVEACLDTLGLEVRAIQPQTWKRFYGLIGKAKDDARTKALTLYPSADRVLARKKDINRADALLMAHWAERTMA